MEKLKFIEKRGRRASFLEVLVIKCILSSLSLGLFLSSPLWIPKGISCAMNFKEVLFGPKFVFVLFNVIVFLLAHGKEHSGGADVYDEYMVRNLRIREIATADDEVETEEGEKSVVLEPSMEDEDLEEEEHEHEEGDEVGLPVDELNKRIEDFIARIKEQREIEARRLL